MCWRASLSIGVHSMPLSPSLWKKILEHYDASYGKLWKYQTVTESYSLFFCVMQCWVNWCLLTNIFLYPASLMCLMYINWPLSRALKVSKAVLLDLSMVTLSTLVPLFVPCCPQSGGGRGSGNFTSVLSSCASCLAGPTSAPRQQQSKCTLRGHGHSSDPSALSRGGLL